MMLFDGNRAWFSPNVPPSHIHTWHVNKSSVIQYYFTDNITSGIEDRTTLELLRSQDTVVYDSSWIIDSSVSRTKQPLGSYALSTKHTLAHPQRPNTALGRRTPKKVESVYGKRRSLGGEFTSPEYWKYADRQHRGQGRHSRQQASGSVRSGDSSRSLLPASGSHHRCISRLVIHADHRTRMGVLANVSDFTPNANGFVAYKIPKLH
ncbi:hypothetical protein LPJ66_001822 [Kickxella alabastrina]|uniref:Uncharacterized protein n=1 Tax=Kickxella alabastrina TaxID=61397 RepID=A0ACC1IS81_9FUNG|nr:hypothetical protein LPJ66_001822 [Kickxella alabastrina]